MSYQEEYYKLIENHTFYQLPSQDMINSDQRVALAIIKNYQKLESELYYFHYLYLQ